ncbi:MAG: DUF1934 domain-containing protein [Acutalibacteraceae bacterium]|nr:DUF1934 domain-containing protein [Acutalibacteraceae bacterium]
MKEALIEIKGTQQLPEGEPDITTFTTTGSIQKTDEELIISYCESEMIGAKNVKTNITVKGDTVTIKRSGGMESQLIIQKGRRHSCLYNTEQGDFVIGIFGESLLTEFAEKGGKIYMSYTIDVYSGLLSKNIMEIKFKEI